MAKRDLSPDDSAKAKKTKTVDHSFFSKTITPTSKQQKSKKAKGKKDDGDAKFARELAEEDGITLEQIKAEEKSREKARKEMKKVTAIDESSSDDDMIIIEPTSTVFPVASTSKLPPITTAKRPKPVTAPVKQPILSTPPPLTSTPRPSPGKPTASFFASPGSIVASSSAARADVSLDTSIFFFDPLTAIDNSSWPAGRLPYSFVVAAFDMIASTKSRLSIVQIMTNLLRVVISLDRASLLPLVWLITSRLGPSYSSDLELGIGSQVLGKAITAVSGISHKAMSSLSKKLGDPGDVAYEAVKSVRLLAPLPPLVVYKLYETLVGISKLKG
jgi:DNA ligase-1